jgi:hypothetical protein
MFPMNRDTLDFQKNNNIKETKFGFIATNRFC